MGILTDNNIIQSIYQKGKGKRYVQFVFGCLLVALAFNLFYAPNDIVAGGVSGLSLVLKHIFGINSSMFILIANLFLLVLSYFFLGKETTKMTIFGSLLFPLLVNLTQNLSTYISFQQSELILVAVFGGLLQGIGAGLIFKAGFTTGGTDILNMIVSRKLHISMGKCYFTYRWSDCVVWLFCIWFQSLNLCFDRFISCFFCNGSCFAWYFRF